MLSRHLRHELKAASVGGLFHDRIFERHVLRDRVQTHHAATTADLIGDIFGNIARSAMLNAITRTGFGAFFINLAPASFVNLAPASTKPAEIVPRAK
jgi:hypothetical protein